MKNLFKFTKIIPLGLFLVFSLNASEGFKETKNTHERPVKGERKGKFDGQREKGHHRGERGNSHTASLLQRLKLDETQRETAKNLMEEMKTEQKSIHEEIKALMTKMEELQSSENPNEGEMIDVGSKLGALKVKAGFGMKKFFTNLKPHLTAEQLKTLEEIQNRFAERRKEFHRKFRKGGEKGDRGEKGRKMMKKRKGNESEK